MFLDIDDCTPKPCGDNGACTDQVNGYSCTCEPGFTGEQCQTGREDCLVISSHTLYSHTVHTDNMTHDCGFSSGAQVYYSVEKKINCSILKTTLGTRFLHVFRCLFIHFNTIKVYLSDAISLTLNISMYMHWGVTELGTEFNRINLI